METSVKEKILYEANKVIAEKGLNSFTLEEVARKAGISKGGLLYHYPSKDQLIKGLIEYYIEQSCCNVDNPGWITSFIRERFSHAEADRSCMAGLLAAIAMNQELLQPVRDKHRELIGNIGALRDPVMGMIICLACYGMAFLNLFGIDVFSDEDMQKVRDRLINLSKECDHI